MPLTQAARTPHTMSSAGVRRHAAPTLLVRSAPLQFAAAASARSIAFLASRSSLSAAAQSCAAQPATSARRRSAIVAACAASSTASARLARPRSAATAACLACRAATSDSQARPRALSSAAFATRRTVCRGGAAPVPPPAAQPCVCRRRAASGRTYSDGPDRLLAYTGRAAAVRRACHSTPARAQALHCCQPWSHASASGSPLAPCLDAADVVNYLSKDAASTPCIKRAACGRGAGPGSLAAGPAGRGASLAARHRDSNNS